MADPISALQSAGFSQDEINQWAQQRRQALLGAGFSDKEADAYFSGGPVVPDGVPQALNDRLEAGDAARKRETGLIQTVPQFIGMMGTPEGRTKLWNAVKQYPAEVAKGLLQQAEIPGEVAKGNIDLNTPEGVDQAIGLGMLVGTARMNKMGITGKTSGLSIASGEPMARIERGPTGQIYDQPIGQLPDSSDFVNAAKSVTGSDAPKPLQDKLLTLYKDQGIHPAEAAIDAQTDPVVAQKLASSDPTDLPYTKEENGPLKITIHPQPKEAEVVGGGEQPPQPPTETPPGSFDEAQQKILEKISIGEQAPSRDWTLDRLYTNTIDKLFPISKVVSEVDPSLPTVDNPYHLSRLLSGYGGKADYMLNKGTFDFNTYQINGPPLKDVLAPVTNDLNGFRAYAAAARAQELEARGIKTGFDMESAQKVVDEGQSKYSGVLSDLVDYQDRVAGYMKDSGVLSAQGLKAMREANKLYVPFNRVMEPDEGAFGSGGTLQASNPIKRIKGSERDIIDPIENVIRNTYLFTQMAEKNAIGLKLVDMLKGASEELPEAKSAVQKLPGPEDSAVNKALSEALEAQGIDKPDELASAFGAAATPTKAGEIAVFRNGKRETYKVDPDLARAMKGLDIQSVGMLEKLLSIPASTLRAGAVTNPDFALRHSIRDYLYAAVTSKGFFSPLDMAKGFAGLIAKDEGYWNWLKGGGSSVSMVSMDRTFLQQDLRKLSGETGLMSRAWNVLADPEAAYSTKAGAVAKLPFQAVNKFVISPLQYLTTLAESASHLGAFKREIQGETKADIQGAAFKSRDVAVDAARMGASMRAYNMITAFANITLQDTDRVVRAFANDPIGTSFKIGAAITVPSMLLWWANKDDPRYKEIPEWQKDLFWIVMTKNHVFRIPKPWGMGIMFGSMPERAADYYYSQNPDAFHNLGKSITEAMIPQFYPTAASPIIDQFANRSTFTNRTLVPDQMEKMLPEYQYTPYTTELTKTLGKIISAFPGVRSAALDPDSHLIGGTARALSSPILLENYIRAWSGNLGMYALNAADAALRKTGVLPDPVKPASTLADIPVIKAFVIRYPSATAQSIQDFYDRYEQNKVFYNTWMAKAKEGDSNAVARIQSAGGPMMFVQLDGIKKALNEHSQLIRDIYNNQTVPADEKRQLIDSIYYHMIQIGDAGKQMIQRIDQHLSSQTQH